MYDLIFRFLLDSGFPRGSILSDDTAVQSGQVEQLYHPAFLIVDPQSAETLAVIDVVESGTLEQLSSHALHAGRFAAKIGRHGAQSFVIQVDSDNPDASEQVRFYKLLPGKKMQQISSYAFPDLEALQVARKLQNRVREPQESQSAMDSASADSAERDKGSQVLYFLSFILVMLCALDWTLLRTHGAGIFTLQQILLLISAAGMLALLVVTRQLRRSD